MQVLTMWVVISPYEIFDHIDLELYFNILYFCRLMFYINSAINPILYNIMSSKFREGFRKVFHCIEWPLTPRRLAEARARSRPRFSTTSNDWSRRRLATTTTSSGQGQAGQDPAEETPPMIELQSDLEHRSPAPSEKSDPAFSKSDQHHNDKYNFSRHHHQYEESNSKNIVFIEERKILVIPTTETGGSSSKTSL